MYLKYVNSMKAIKISTEAIDFQLDTKLADNLTAAIQGVLDFKQSLTKENKSNGYITREVLGYLEDTADDKIHECLRAILCVEPKNLKLFKFNVPCGAVCATFDIKDIDNLMFLIYREGTKQARETISTYKDLNDFRNALNLKTGRMHFSQNILNTLSIKIMFDPYYFFLGKEVGVDLELTAREISSILLHECGHFISTVELLMNCTVVSRAMTETAKAFIKQATPDETLKFINSVDKTNIVIDRYNAISKMMLNVSSLEKATHNIKFTDVLETDAKKALNYVMCGASTFNGFEQVVKYVPEQGIIYNPMYPTLIDMSLCERYADIFVTRMRYGADNASALSKTISIQPLRTSNVTIATFNISQALIKLSTFAGGSALLTERGLYEDPTQRMRRIMMSIIDGLKSDKLPDEVIAEFIKDYERIAKLITKPTNLDTAYTGAKIWDYISLFLPTSLAHMAASGRFSRDYNKLKLEIDKLIDNELHYLKHKLRMKG